MKIRSLLKSAAFAGFMTVAAGSAPLLAADLTVGANIGNVPWEFQDETGKTVGFEIDLVNEVAGRLGKSVAFENIPFNGLFSAVQSGRTASAQGEASPAW